MPLLRRDFRSDVQPRHETPARLRYLPGLAKPSCDKMAAVRERSGGEDEWRHDGRDIQTSTLTLATTAIRARAMRVEGENSTCSTPSARPNRGGRRALDTHGSRSRDYCGSPRRQPHARLAWAESSIIRLSQS